jgi:hypothetical protein
MACFHKKFLILNQFWRVWVWVSSEFCESEGGWIKIASRCQQMPANASKLGQKEALEQALAFPKLQVPLQSAHTSGNTDIITDILFPYFLKPLDAQNHLKSGWKIHLQVYLNDNMLKPRRKHSQVVLGDSLKLATCP